MSARTPSTALLRPTSTTTTVRRGRRLGVPLAAALLCVPLLAGCADSSTQDYCSQYEDLVASAEELRAKDPATTDVEELQTAAADVRTELDQFQAVADGRLDDALTRLRDRVDGVRQQAAAGAESLEAARPQIEEELAGVEAAWSAVQGLAETRCSP